jgi:hypothetical protein
VLLRSGICVGILHDFDRVLLISLQREFMIKTLLMYVRA